MADLRTSFPILEVSGTEAGVPLHKVLEGDASASKNALAALAFKDVAGNLRYPKVNANDELIISTESTDIACLTDRIENAAGSATNVNLATISLLVDHEYQEIGFVVSCARDALFQIVQIDDATTTILADMVVGSGAYALSQELKCLSITSGSTGTQTLKIVAKNLNALSALRATLTVTEVQ